MLLEYWYQVKYPSCTLTVVNYDCREFIAQATTVFRDYQVVVYLRVVPGGHEFVVNDLLPDDIFSHHRRHLVNVLVFRNVRIVQILLLVLERLVGSVHVARGRSIGDASLAAGKTVRPAPAKDRAQLERQGTLKNIYKVFWVGSSVTKLGDLWTLGKFLKHLATINLPTCPSFLGNFCEGVKIYHFSSEIIFGQLL